MLEKWRRGPQKIGMALGFVALPLLWFIQDKLLRFGIGLSWSPNLELLDHFVAGAVPGAILGAGISKAIFAVTNNNWSDCKRQLIGHSLAVLTLIALLIFGIPLSLHNWRLPLFLPLHLALLMFFLGLLMRSRR
ncbi:MAG TPA: hypothetical protein VGB45_02300 [Abditibacterium sp.]|jgi:hypothetical protein